MTYPFEAVWMTTQASGTPHAEALQAANPGLRTHACFSPQGEGEELIQRWRNCDRNIRAWWDENRGLVESDQVVFFEYDVFCNVDLRDRLPVLGGPFGLAGPRIVSGLTEARNFWPFEDAPRLPRAMQALVCATAPLAVALLTRAALDAICSAEYDAIFAEDIFCEVRLPTVVRNAGFKVVAMDLPQVDCRPKPPTFPGIWHPVKTPVSFTS